MELQNIADVITALEKIINECESAQNPQGYFAALYKRMTVAVSEGILNGSFEDGKRMERLDLVFAQRYLDAQNCYQEQQPCSASWQFAFNNCKNKSLIVLQHLLLGINTHINLDLAIAAAAIAPGNGIYALENDFNRINDVIASLVDDVQECLAKLWFPMRWLRRIAVHQQEAVLNFSIGTARKAAWANALLLANMDPQQQKIHIQQMDTSVKQIAQKICSPGLWSAFLLKFIRMTEYKDITRTINIIDTTVAGIH